jgi:DNA-directed RNA polymerase beta' subunit
LGNPRVKYLSPLLLGYGIPSTTARVLVRYDGLADLIWLKIQSSPYRKLYGISTFHSTGISNKVMTQGVPRFQELLNATKDPANINHKIYFKKGFENVENLRKEVGHTIAGLTLKDISESMEVYINKESESWYESYKVLYNDNFSEYTDCISIKLNKKKMFEHKLCVEEIVKIIDKEYSDLYCVFSPPSHNQLDIFVDTTHAELPENRVLFIDSENANEIYLEECVQPILEKMYVCGIPGINEIFYTKDEKANRWFIETNAINSKSISSQYSSFKKILSHPGIDNTTTVSNNMWDIYETFGIEATRQFLIEEFLEIMDGINDCHAKLLVDRMCHSGTIASITRYTLRKDEAGPFCRASFEETVDQFLNAGVQGQIEPTKGVSASIICGKRSSIGSGMMDLRINIKGLPVSKIFKETDVKETDEIPEFVDN